jgi:hypothetical protein
VLLLDHRLSEELDKIGLKKGSIFEIILTTSNPDGSRNAAPMGVKRVEPLVLELKPFKSSNTYRNLILSQRACINITNDPELFFLTSFKEEEITGFVELKIDDDLRLVPSDANVFVRVIKSEDISELRSRFLCEAVGVEFTTITPEVFSRGKAEAIEAIIHATRIEIFTKGGRMKELECLNKKFFSSKEVVLRVSAKDSKEARIIKKLGEMMARWREEI